MPYAIDRRGRTWFVDAVSGLVRSGVSPLIETVHNYGDLAMSGDTLFCVREDVDGDELVAIDTRTVAAKVLRSTAGFIASPRPGTRALAWTQWSQDAMPWDACEVWIAEYTKAG